jgi:ATP-dependent DNA helicase RecQ
MTEANDRLVILLKEVFGWKEFRPVQKQVIDAVYQGEDTLAILPTGGGKSLCYQVPGLAKEGICIVISPLIALMKDQVDYLKARGVKAVALHAGMSAREIDTLLDNCIRGGVKFLYLSPERLKSELFVERFKQMNLNLIAVDEAHCISQWGYDFRPAYLEIATIRAYHPKVNVLALTASATPEVEKDILEKLQLKKPATFHQSFARKNLSYSVRLVENKLEKGLEILKRISGSAIWYVRTRQATQQLAKQLQQMGFSAAAYHAGMTALDRSAKQEAWKANQVRIMVSTNAFGMGIDKPDVRVVLHSDLPENLESYYQEAGRAGRDGQKAFAVLLTNAQDFEQLLDRAALVYPPIEFLRRVYQCLANYFQLAIGAQSMRSHDFEISDFANTYQLPVLDSFYALKVLEEEGLIALNESFFAPSRAHFLVNPQRLYEVQIQHAKLDPVVKILLRTHGGNLFSEYFNIQEAKLAKAAGMDEAVLIKGLLELSKMEVLDYEPRKDRPQLTFLTERYDAATLPLNFKRITLRRELTLHKATQMVAYAHQTRICRTQFIQSYFGEFSDESCGACDHCIEEKKASLPLDVETKFREQVLQTLATDEVFSEEELFDAVNKPASLGHLKCLRQLVEEGKVEVSTSGKYKRRTDE